MGMLHIYIHRKAVIWVSLIGLLGHFTVIFSPFQGEKAYFFGPSSVWSDLVLHFTHNTVLCCSEKRNSSLPSSPTKPPSATMGRGFSEEEINELKEQFELFDMMGDGECWEFLLWAFRWLLWESIWPNCVEEGRPSKGGGQDRQSRRIEKERYNGIR
jgi:hypothetical protein